MVEAKSTESIRKESESLYLLAKEKEMVEKELRYRQMQRNLIEDYLQKKDFSKQLDFSVLGEEYEKLRIECEAYGDFNKIRKIIASGKIQRDNIKKILRNPEKRGKSNAK